MAAWIVLTLGACVVSILAGLSGPWTASISAPESETKRSRKPVKPRLPPEVIAVLNRNLHEADALAAAMRENAAEQKVNVVGCASHKMPDSEDDCCP
jgi:hypothetical protein